MRPQERFSKAWIYIPLYLILVAVTVWLLYNWINAPKPVEKVPIVQEEPGISDTFKGCFLKNRSELAGTIQLLPWDYFSASFELEDTNCLSQICDILKEIEKGKTSRTEFYELAEEDNFCFQNLLKKSIIYHNQQLENLSLFALFYASGQSDLTTSQKNYLNVFLRAYRKNLDQFGLLIIGRASKIGSIDKNKQLSKERSENIEAFIRQQYKNQLQTDFVYFGAEPPQLDVALAERYGIEKSDYQAIKYNPKRDPDFSIRLNQSVLLVIYEKERDPFDLKDRF